LNNDSDASLHITLAIECDHVYAWSGALHYMMRKYLQHVSAVAPTPPAPPEATTEGNGGSDGGSGGGGGGLAVQAVAGMAAGHLVLAALTDELIDLRKASVTTALRGERCYQQQQRRRSQSAKTSTSASASASASDSNYDSDGAHPFAAYRAGWSAASHSALQALKERGGNASYPFDVTDRYLTNLEWVRGVHTRAPSAPPATSSRPPGAKTPSAYEAAGEILRAGQRVTDAQIEATRALIGHMTEAAEHDVALVDGAAKWQMGLSRAQLELHRKTTSVLLGIQGL
jgi:hypothetical protein